MLRPVIGILHSTDQAFGRQSAVEPCHIFAAEQGTVNTDASQCETSCYGSSVCFPCYTAPEPVLCRSCQFSPAVQGQRGALAVVRSGVQPVQLPSAAGAAEADPGLGADDP